MLPQQLKYMNSYFRAINEDLDFVPIFWDEQVYFASIQDFEVGSYGMEPKTFQTTLCLYQIPVLRDNKLVFRCA